MPVCLLNALCAAAGHLRRGIGRLRSFRLRRFVLRLDGGREAFEELYEVGEKIGNGSFGKVYACCERRVCVQTDRYLCAKVVPMQGNHVERDTRLHDDDKRRLLLDFRNLDHPYLVRYYRFVQTSDALYIIMHRCRGPDLPDHVAACGGLLPPSAVQSLACQMLKALEALHSMRMMHRDVKPENFRFDDPRAETLKLLDFGSAKATAGVPASHTVTGTLLYAAPEVFDGVYWNACDLWSVGIVIFFLLTGQLPVETSDVMILRSMHRDPVLMGKGLFRDASLWAEVPGGAKRLVRGLLTTDPSSRLTAEKALAGPWLGDGWRESMRQIPSYGSLSGGDGSDAPSSAKRLNNLNSSLNDLKRSYFVWDLAKAGDGGGSSGGETLDDEWENRTHPAQRRCATRDTSRSPEQRSPGRFPRLTDNLKEA